MSSSPARQVLAERDGGWFCAYCRCPHAEADLVRDHVVPRSQGGPDGAHNRVLACRLCDSAKAGRTPQEWQPGVVFGNPVVDVPTRERRTMPHPTPSVPDAPPHSIGVLVPTGRRTARLRATPFADVRFCATCQRAVDIRRAHPPGHLLVESGEYEPGRARAS